ncbi:MAG: hypothetical protein MZV63_00720 [Marinilabiliales bacterium]|nr:hypothetical protein [Marinilabiliales bacterium]
MLDKNDEENRSWTLATWDFAKQILPLLAIGVVTAGFLLGSTHDGKTIAGVIPNEWISSLVGGNSCILQLLRIRCRCIHVLCHPHRGAYTCRGLIASGMGKGPALALLLAGPSLSLA